MSRDGAIARAQRYFDDGGFQVDLERRVAIPSESQNPARRHELERYLSDELCPSLEALGFKCRLIDNPDADGGPFLVARRMEAEDHLTVMSYGHADVVHGQEGEWRDGMDPWRLTVVGERLYGRGTADNKGQHTINIAALAAVLEERGNLGFNLVILFETGEETRSEGLREICSEHRDLFVADVFVASDGPRVASDRPTVFLGTRGTFNFDMTVDLREGGHHSGNWGGLLANPGIILAHAIARITTQTGAILIDAWRPDNIPQSVRKAIARIDRDGGEGAPEIDPAWGEPGLSAMEKVIAWNSFEVLAFETGDPDNPVNAIPPRAKATCHLRYVVPTEPETLIPALRKMLDENGFEMVRLEPDPEPMRASRLDPDHPWVGWVVASMERTAETDVAILPNLGGSLPNDIFADLLGLPTIWVPHSHPACCQHAPNEHVLAPVCRQALGIMAGLWWDLGEPGARALAGR